MDTATALASVYTLGFLTTAFLVAVHTMRHHPQHTTFEVGIIGLVGGVLWPFVAAAWGLGQVATLVRPE